MEIICEKCKKYRSYDRKAIANHRRNCSNNNKLSGGDHLVKQQFSVSQYIFNGISKVSNAIIGSCRNNIPKEKSKSSTANDQYNKNTLLNDLDNYGDADFSNHLEIDEQRIDESILEPQEAENKYILFQRRITSLWSTTNTDSFGYSYNHVRYNNRNTIHHTNGILSQLNIGYTPPIVSWDQYTQSLNQSNNFSTVSDSEVIQEYRTPQNSNIHHSHHNMSLQKRNKLGLPDPRDLLDIFIYCKQNFLTEKQGDNLLQVIRRMYGRHPPIEMFFLHRNVSSIQKSINRAVDSLYTTNEIHITLPKALSGQNSEEIAKISKILDPKNTRHIIASGIGLDVLEIISETLVSHDYEKFDFLPKSEMYNNERCISSFVSADFYKVIFEKVQNTCGVDVFPFCFSYGCDSTPVSGGGVGTKNFTPLNIRFLQFNDMDMFRSTESRSLVGILPAFTISKSKFKDIISTSINLIEYQKDCIQFMKTNMKHKLNYIILYYDTKNLIFILLTLLILDFGEEYSFSKMKILYYIEFKFV
jgi:hypothetical protein